MRWRSEGKLQQKEVLKAAALAPYYQAANELKSTLNRALRSTVQHSQTHTHTTNFEKANMSSRLSLFDLPAELRTTIYERVADSCFIVISGRNRPHNNVVGAKALLVSCRQVYKELQPILHERTPHFTDAIYQAPAPASYNLRSIDIATDLFPQTPKRVWVRVGVDFSTPPWEHYAREVWSGVLSGIAGAQSAEEVVLVVDSANWVLLTPRMLNEVQYRLRSLPCMRRYSLVFWGRRRDAAVPGNKGWSVEASEILRLSVWQ